MDGGFDVQSDSEIYFQGSLESDMGLKFTVHVQLEANNEAHTEPSGDDTEIDESFARMSGEFGTIEIGQRDPIHARTHYAAAFGAGVGLNAGDTQKWIPGAYLETAGWTIPGDNLNVIYISPRVNGVQVGVSYGPDSKSENSTTSAPTDNDDAVWAAGINFNETIGDMSFKVSLGHANVSNTGSLAYNDDNDDTSQANATADMVKGFDDKTYTNAGLQVGMGAFTFSASYATRDDGGYSMQCMGDVGTDDNNNANDVVVACGEADATTGVFPGPDTAEVNTVSAVEDESGQHDTIAIGISYSDGPMTVSIGHMSRDREDGMERTATMVSAGYKLAPGVSWKTSLFGVEEDGGAEGSAFVTGLDIDF